MVAGTGAAGAEPTSVLGQTATESTSCQLRYGLCYVGTDSHTL